MQGTSKYDNVYGAKCSQFTTKMYSIIYQSLVLTHRRATIKLCKAVVKRRG